MSLATMCAMPMADSAMDLSTQDAASCRIECACGCNQDIDGLPHLLSPHLISELIEFPNINALSISEVYLCSDCAYRPSVQLPPPDLS